jgi:hypothetical protein
MPVISIFHICLFCDVSKILVCDIVSWLYKIENRHSKISVCSSAMVMALTCFNWNDFTFTKCKGSFPQLAIMMYCYKIQSSMKWKIWIDNLNMSHIPLAGGDIHLVNEAGSPLCSNHINIYVVEMINRAMYNEWFDVIRFFSKLAHAMTCQNVYYTVIRYIDRYMYQYHWWSHYIVLNVTRTAY